MKHEKLIICNNEVKENLLERKEIENIKYMTLSEFKKLFFFDYNEDTIYYIKDKYNIKPAIAKVYLESLYYIDNANYSIKKLKFLKELKEDLIGKDYLIQNELFKEYLKNTSIVFYDIYLDDYFKEKLKGIKYEIEIPKLSNYEHSIYEFNTKEEEIAYVAHQISDLIYQGVSISNIKLANIDSSYYNDLSRIFSLYNLHVHIPYKSPLSSFKYVKDFINDYQNNGLEYAYDNLDKLDPLYNSVIDIINKYKKYQNKNIIINKLEEEYINAPNYEEEIAIIDYIKYITNDNDYVFMLNFNDGAVPKIYKDEDYLDDNIKAILKVETTREKNKRCQEEALKKIKGIKNLTITYKLRDEIKTYYKSILCDKFNILTPNKVNLISYSDKYNKLKLAKSIDEYIKYGNKEEDFYILQNNFDIKYNSFNNKYQKINRIQDKLTLSYSKMNIYNKCAFRYYLTDILKLDIYEENFSAIIGSMIHYILENVLKNNDNDYIKYKDQFLKDKVLNSKEKFFLNKYIEIIPSILSEIEKEKECSKLDNAMYEEKINVDYGNNVNFIGYIDKILYKEEFDKTILSLVDYKTGADDISLKYLKYGINIQLPIYLYLSKKLMFKNPVYSGFYLQRLNLQEKDYKLIGYSNSNKEILSYIDNNYDNSNIIKSLKTNTDGSFSKNSKVLSNDEINKIIDITEKIIKNNIESIKNNIFDINPKKDGDKLIGCEYCKFKDICFVKNKDYTKISETSLEEIE